MATQSPKESKARLRILETAERLFYSEGIRNVGIDRVIAEAGVAKMTLYNHFPSKDDLILEVLKFREKKVEAMFKESMERHVERGEDTLTAFFAALREWFESPAFRGCAFINAVAELADTDHPGTKFSAAHKQRFHDTIHQAVIESAGVGAAAMGPAVDLLVEGAIVAAVLEQSPDAADRAKSAALKLIESATVDA